MPGPKLQSIQLSRGPTPLNDVVDSSCEEGAKWMALGVIAESSFPCAARLPRVAPLPKAQVGHQMLVDYALMAGIVWGTVKRLQRELRAAKFRRLALTCISCLLFILALTWTFTGSTGVIGVVLLIALAVAVPVIGLVTWADVNSTIARVKSAVMEDIMKGKYQDLVDESDVGQGEPLVGWTNGVVSTEGALICYSVVPHDQLQGSGEIFSGLGFPIATAFYGCQPNGKDGTSRLSSTDDAIAAVRGVLRGLWRELQDDQTQIRMGDVVVVDPSSLKDPKHNSVSQTQVPWLDDDGRPRLRVSMPLDVPDIKVQSYGGRKFLAVQLLFGEGATVATILLRPSVASGAAVLETVLITIGPPRWKQEWIEQQLADLRRSYGGGRVSGISYFHLWLRGIVAGDIKIGPPSPLLGASHIARVAQPNLSELFKLEPYAHQIEKLEGLWAERLATGQPRWIGRRAELLNYRTSVSAVFASGKDAAHYRTALILVHDRIVREILTCFDARGYDISKYRSESGQWQINAESIQNISITENRQGGEREGRRSPVQQGSNEGKR